MNCSYLINDRRRSASTHFKTVEEDARLLPRPANKLFLLRRVAEVEEDCLTGACSYYHIMCIRTTQLAFERRTTTYHGCNHPFFRMCKES